MKLNNKSRLNSNGCPIPGHTLNSDGQHIQTQAEATPLTPCSLLKHLRFAKHLPGGFPGEQEIGTPVPTCSLTVSSPVWPQSPLEYRYQAIHGPRWSISPLSVTLGDFRPLQWPLWWPLGWYTAADRCVVSEVTLLRSRYWFGFPHPCNPVQAAELSVPRCSYLQNRAVSEYTLLLHSFRVDGGLNLTKYIRTVLKC